MENEWTFDLHPTEETLEEYCFSRLSEGQTAALEEHLLVCATCQQTLQYLDEYILLMKVAAAEFCHSSGDVPARLWWERGSAAITRQNYAWNALWVVGILWLAAVWR